ncbi:conserved hypothetical protein [Leishmania major strain Friedlin]|uniref:Uncharacterized protein n=1 Tax=Leishmania major TaxID=5664 RepID=Q4QG20_LEIMA|nr:conserved hypothetical protein [Leishmania major strain Friedlin]CAG9571125.1 hypothetical_protein_-_conserved [Leishmania major strain Friedlin]CAJ03106.1 conserved hypothetical protein [Leishmania major strain Friedlin]|eukprot:XP_001681878.1 conserved hypothetical protein [Leishmania major strain Friedlin]
MSRRALFASDSDDDSADVFRLAAAGAGDRAMSGTSGSSLAKDPLSAGAASQLHPSSLDSDRRSTAAVQLPESSKLTATRQNLSQLFCAGPTPLTMRGMSSSPNQPPAMQAAAAGNVANGASVDTDSGATEATAFFAPRFDYDGNGATGAAGGAAAALAAATGEAAAGLITAEHAVVQAYRDSLYSGTCMLALCVPLGTASAATTSAALPPSAALRRHLREQQEAVAASKAATGGPTLLLISSNRQVLCRVALDATDAVFSSDSLRLRQDAAQPQYLTFFDIGCTGICGGSSAERFAAGGGGSGCWWMCMFPDRDKASRFLISTYTVAQYAAALAQRTGTASAPVPSVRTLPALPPSKRDKAAASAAGGAPDMVRPDVPATICWQTWTLRRVSRETVYCVLGSCVEAVPPSAPRTVAATDGTLWDAAAAALVGMRTGESRLVFLTPEDTRVRQSKSRTDSRRSDRPGRSAPQLALNTSAVIYMTCLQAASSPVGTPAPSTPTAARDLAPPLPPPPPPAPATAAAATRVSVSASLPAAEPSQAPGADDALSTNALLQQLLLHFLQQQPQQPLPSASASRQGASPQVWESIECALARVQVQLGSVYEKLDRLDIEATLQRNNAELERVMRRVVGRAPQEEVAIEDALKNREELLASIERHRHKFEEANANYQRALEAMGRLSDRAQALERDLRLQQDIWAQQRKDEAEQMRLRLVERDARHRDELEIVSEERYAAGRSDGHAAGYREGRQATLLEVEGSGTGGDGGGSVVMQWREKLMAKDQEVIALQTALQDAKFRHDRDRRQLRAEIDVLTELNEKLQHLQANADVRVPEETVQQQCKRIKRTLNAVYNQVEEQLLQLSSLERRSQPGGRRSLPTVDEGNSIEGEGEALDADGSGSSGVVAVDDVLAIVTVAIRSEAQVAVTEIRSDGAQRAAANAELRARTLARRSGQYTTPALYDGHRPSTSSALLVGCGVEEEAGGLKVEPSSLAKRASTPPPLPPVHTAASQDALAAVAATLLPKVAQAASMKASAAEGAAEATFHGDGHLCEGTAVARATASPVAAEEPFHSKTGTQWGDGGNGGAGSVACQPYSAPAHADPGATAAASVLSSAADRKGANFRDVGADSLHSALSRSTTAPIPEIERDLVEARAGKALRWNVGDRADGGGRAFSSAFIAAGGAADDAAAARASAALWSSPGVGDEVQRVPTPNATAASITTTSSTPTRMDADSPFTMNRAHVALEVEHAADTEKAPMPRCSTDSLSPLSTPAKQGRMATRLPADAPALPPPPLSAPHSECDDGDGTRLGDTAIGDSPSASMREAACVREPRTDASQQALPLVPPVLPNDTPLVGAAADRATPSCDAQLFSSPSTALRDWQGSRLFGSPPSTGGE